MGKIDLVYNVRQEPTGEEKVVIGEEMSEKQREGRRLQGFTIRKP